MRVAASKEIDGLEQNLAFLATVGSTSPYVGLFGTVWGIYHALTAIASAGQISIERVAGPVGEPLVMTAAGLAVAIPAVLAYNIFGRLLGRIEADLEGFARDLRELVVDASPTTPVKPTAKPAFVPKSAPAPVPAAPAPTPAPQ